MKSVSAVALAALFLSSPTVATEVEVFDAPCHVLLLSGQEQDMLQPEFRTYLDGLMMGLELGLRRDADPETYVRTDAHKAVLAAMQKACEANPQMPIAAAVSAGFADAAKQ